jgi:urease accessory protein
VNEVNEVNEVNDGKLPSPLAGEGRVRGLTSLTSSLHSPLSVVTEKARAPHPGAARVGIGGPVGSGKTALLEQLIPRFIERGTNLAVITNDVATKEDAERVKRSGLIDPERVAAVETGACPHTAIREDPTLNMQAADDLEAKFAGLDLVLIESGGDNLASTFSLDLVDYWLFVIDVAGGDDIPRKKGLGILQCDLLVINKTDLAPYVRTDLKRMVREAGEVRAGRPVLLTNCATGEGVDAVVENIAAQVLFDR